ncbi:polysaccharide pyruvyl transferase family protein [Pedobacter mucosus]|uniref:polysaccharide pyruvyl transferase family protein n=1 Tax=Pedobacter mucosus TaxID=2895286 RepID=UPI001EE49FF4|nr:polysaccharide pyruvyl transferase family protein [Pedobacter mucosus]UKT64943.1 twin-arginine translocation signal domain-containing protein [Pedobacter mucosus]
MLNRRTFVKSTAALAFLAAIGNAGSVTAGIKAKKTVLLCSSWQTFNIGDIAHTPGVLAILEKQLPNVDVILWPHDVANGVKEMLEKRFPKYKIVQSEVDIQAAFKKADLLLHGSGPSLVGRNSIVKWVKQTGKPYGIYGITFPGVYAAKNVTIKATPLDIDLVNKAAFVFFRDSISLKFAKDNGLTCPIMEFGPDGTFAVDLNNEAAALAFMKEHGLEEGKFMCCIPRYRFTEEWLAKGKNRPFNQQHVDYNMKMKDHDNGPLRDAITAVVRQTNMKILICPEDETQVALGKSLLLDQLPEDVKKKVVWRDKYWLTDEALSTYKRSAGLFGLEMHSPIICIGQGIPAVVCRFYEQSTKGFMWKDIGLNDWLFDMDEPAQVEKLVPTVLSIALNPKAAKAKALKARAFVQKRQKETMQTVFKSL